MGSPDEETRLQMAMEVKVALGDVQIEGLQRALRVIDESVVTFATERAETEAALAQATDRDELEGLGASLDHIDNRLAALRRQRDDVAARLRAREEPQG